MSKAKIADAAIDVVHAACMLNEIGLDQNTQDKIYYLVDLVEEYERSKKSVNSSSK